jgi:hypothetical protein
MNVNEEAVARLVALAEGLGLISEDLDEFVYESTNEVAASRVNEGTKPTRACTTRPTSRPARSTTATWRVSWPTFWSAAARKAWRYSCETPPRSTDEMIIIQSAEALAERQGQSRKKIS